VHLLGAVIQQGRGERDHHVMPYETWKAMSQTGIPAKRNKQGRDSSR
jgi:hypothetical protein